MEPIFASTTSTHDNLRADLNPLLKENGGVWNITSDGKALETSWRFGGFNKAWAFMSAVAEEAKKEKHHPEWSNVYNRVIVRWTTHKDRETKNSGLTSLDIRLALRTHELAREHGAKLELIVTAHEDQITGREETSNKSQLEALSACNICAT